MLWMEEFNCCRLEIISANTVVCKNYMFHWWKHLLLFLDYKKKVMASASPSACCAHNSSFLHLYEILCIKLGWVMTTNEGDISECSVSVQH